MANGYWCSLSAQRSMLPLLERALESAFLDPLAFPEEFGGTGQEVSGWVEPVISGFTAGPGKSRG